MDKLCNILSSPGTTSSNWTHSDRIELLAGDVDSYQQKSECVSSGLWGMWSEMKGVRDG